MQRKMVRDRIFPLCFSLILLAGCSSSAPPPRFPDIRFTQNPPISLDVASIEIVDQFQPSFQPPEVEQQFPVSPQRAIHNWVADQLVAASPDAPRHLRVTILDASVRDVPVPPTAQGISGAFTKEPTDRYDAQESIQVVILDATGTAVRTANAQATLGSFLQEGTSLNDRDVLWYNLARDVTTNLGKAISGQIESGFAPYIK